MTANNMSIGFAGRASRSVTALRQALDALSSEDLSESVGSPPVGSHTVSSKFEPCLPRDVRQRVCAQRIHDVEGARFALRSLGL